MRWIAASQSQNSHLRLAYSPASVAFTKLRSGNGSEERCAISLAARICCVCTVAAVATRVREDAASISLATCCKQKWDDKQIMQYPGTGVVPASAASCLTPCCYSVFVFSLRRSGLLLRLAVSPALCCCCLRCGDACSHPTPPSGFLGHTCQFTAEFHQISSNQYHQ